MAKSLQVLDNALKTTFLDKIEQFLKDLNEGELEVLRVPLSEESTSVGYQLAIPTLDEERNEKTVLISVKVPRGRRDGSQYDPFEENSRYEENAELARAKAEARKEKAERLAAEKERKKNERKAAKVAKMKKAEADKNKEEEPEE